MQAPNAAAQTKKEKAMKKGLQSVKPAGLKANDFVKPGMFFDKR